MEEVLVTHSLFPNSTVRLSFVDLRWAQLYVSLVPIERWIRVSVNVSSCDLFQMAFALSQLNIPFSEISACWRKQSREPIDGTILGFYISPLAAAQPWIPVSWDGIIIKAAAHWSAIWAQYRTICQFYRSSGAASQQASTACGSQFSSKHISVETLW